MSRDVLFEACVDSLASARHAIEAGARRLELCDLTVEAGVTPAADLIVAVREISPIPLHVLIRPRGGDFRYGSAETEPMLRDIQACKQLGVDGIAIGALTPAGEIDTGVMKELIDAARPMAITFHRAFDAATDLFQSLEALIALEIERVLTSGGAPDAEAGIPVLRELVGCAGSRITIMAGGGIRNHNVAKIVRETGVTEVHSSAMIQMP